jgi:pimeloyl-ACP methyl ester carboxylesterase
MTDLPLEPGDHPLYVEGPDGPLLAVFTRTGSPSAPGCIVVGGAGTGGSTKADGFFVRVTRAVAATGYDVARFDWHGIGNSLGHVNRFSLKAPYTGDVRAVADVFIGEGRQLVMAGFCYGSRAVMEVAQEIEDVVGLVLVSYPMPQQLSNKEWAAKKVGMGRALVMAAKPAVLRGWFDRRSRRLYLKWIRLRLERIRNRKIRRNGVAASGQDRVETMESLAGKITRLTDRGVRIRFVYGEGDKQLEPFRQAMVGPLSQAFHVETGLIEVETAPGDLYGWTTVSAQERAIGIVADFARQVATPPNRPKRELRDSRG